MISRICTHLKEIAKVFFTPESHRRGKQFSRTTRPFKTYKKHEIVNGQTNECHQTLNPYLLAKMYALCSRFVRFDCHASGLQIS